MNDINEIIQNSNSPDILEQGVERFAVSALSKQRAQEARNEEIVVDKYTGEFLLKTKDGVLLSADTLSRRKASIENALRYVDKTGIGGTLFQIDIEDVQLPSQMDYDMNILDSFIEIEPKYKRILFNLDIDEYVINGGTGVPTNAECYVEVYLTCTKDGVNSDIIFTKPISLINKFVLHLDETNSKTVLNSIKFIKNENEIIDNKSIILHNLFITVNI